MALTHCFKEGATPEASPGERDLIRGHFTSFKRQNGYGFIETEDHEKFFGQVNNVTDIRLKETLQNTPYDAGNTLYASVTFRKGGFTRQDAKCQGGDGHPTRIVDRLIQEWLTECRLDDDSLSSKVDASDR
jgi:hypothetical protein